MTIAAPVPRVKFKNTRFMSVDPGADQGWAAWHRGVLVNCGLGDLPKEPYQGFSLIVERPRIYPPRVAKAKPEDIITLALRAGMAMGKLAWFGMEVDDMHLVEPPDWKGQVKKSIHENRILGALSPQELRYTTEAGDKYGAKAHNVYDAVGLGLWALGEDPMSKVTVACIGILMIPFFVFVALGGALSTAFDWLYFHLTYKPMLWYVQKFEKAFDVLIIEDEAHRHLGDDDDN